LKTITFQLFKFLIPALFLFPLFKESISTFLFLLLVANTLIYTWFEKPNVASLKRAAIYTLPFWVVFVNSALFFDSDSNFIRPLQRSMFFLTFPLLFAFLPVEHFTEKRVRFYLNVLKNCVAIIAIGYFSLFLFYYDFNDFFWFHWGIPKFRTFVYNEVPFFKIHPTYFTCIAFTCTAFAFDNFLKRRKFFELLYVTLFLLTTFMLLAKVNIILMVVLLFAMVIFRSRMSLQRKMISVGIIVSLTTALALAVPGIKNRFVEIFNSYNKSPVGMAFDSTNVRMAVFHCNMQIAKEEFFTGVGFNKVGGRLHKCYEENYDSDFYQQQGYLTHNYYFYFLLSSGIVGLLLFLFYVGYIIGTTFKINSFVLSVTLINVLIICFTEDYFYRQYGIFFFSLIFFSFMKLHEHKTSISAPSENNLIS